MAEKLLEFKQMLSGNICTFSRKGNLFYGHHFEIKSIQWILFKQNIGYKGQPLNRTNMKKNQTCISYVPFFHANFL